MISVYDSKDHFVDPLPEVALLPVTCFAPHGIDPEGIILKEISLRVAEQLPMNVFLLPPWPYGTHSEDDERFNSITLHYQTLSLVIRDIAQSLFDHGIKKIVVINNLGSVDHFSALPYENQIVKTAVRQLNYEIPDLTTIWVQPFRVSADRLQRLLGNDISTDFVVKCIRDSLLSLWNTGERQKPEMNEIVNPNSDSAQKKLKIENDFGIQAVTEITQAIKEYILNSFSAIAMIKRKE